MSVSGVCRGVFLTVAALMLPRIALAQASITELLNNGPDNKRINIVFVSEGYVESQLPRFLAEATTALSKFLGTIPFKEYASYFNAYAISVASQDSGADHPLSSTYRDTFFNSTYYSYQIERLLTIPPNDLDGNWMHGEGRVDSLLQILKPSYDIVIVIVNDGEYGGSGGSIAVISTHSASADVAVHELGHSLAYLGDEYNDPFPGYPDVEEPNTTRTTIRSAIKWNPWILGTTPVPTPDSSPYFALVGLFEGAHYHATGWYRPKHICTMRALGAGFCEVCREQLVLSIYRSIRPVESFAPTDLSLTLNGADSVLLSVVPVSPATHPIALQWLSDGQPISGEQGTAIRIRASDLGNGSHRVQLNAIDSTAYVRIDPMELLRDSVVWTVNVTGSTAAKTIPSDERPNSYRLEQNYPNPFNPMTSIEYSIPVGTYSSTSLRVYDILGREVAALVNERKAPGSYTVRFDAGGLATGVYLYRLTAGDFVQTRKMAVVR